MGEFEVAIGDLDAQFWFARHNFLHGERAIGLEGFKRFKRLAATWTAAEYRNRVRGVVVDKAGSRRRYWGTVKTTQEAFCFISCAEMGTDVFAHINEFQEKQWNEIGTGSSVSFELGFALRGPLALRIELAGKV